MPTGSTTSTTNSVSATNPALNQLFTSLFGGSGGAGSTAIGTLSNIAKGGNISDLNAALTASNKATFSGEMAQIREAFGSKGLASSSSLAQVLGAAAATNTSNLTSTLAGADLQAQGQQLSAASYLSQIFSSAANSYFTDKSTQVQQSSGMSTFLDTFKTLFPGGIGGFHMPRTGGGSGGGFDLSEGVGG